MREWFKAQEGWKNKDGVIIPFEEMSDADLQKVYRYAQIMCLKYMNKFGVMEDKILEMSEEAERRGMTLKGINAEFFQH